jgi:type II secretory pathway pseudopilin PulG
MYSSSTVRLVGSGFLLPARVPCVWRRSAAMTLVEVMVALGLFAFVMLGFIGSFVLSRRVTEGSVMHAAVTSLVYGLVEQMKGLDYKDLLPSTAVDENAPAGWSPPYIRVRINRTRSSGSRPSTLLAPKTRSRIRRRRRPPPTLLSPPATSARSTTSSGPCRFRPCPARYRSHSPSISGCGWMRFPTGPAT